jgi:hypothetical protein
MKVCAGKDKKVGLQSDLLVVLVLVFRISSFHGIWLSSWAIIKKLHISLQNTSILVSFDVVFLQGFINGYHPATVTSFWNWDHGYVPTSYYINLLPLQWAVLWPDRWSYHGITTCSSCAQFWHGIFQATGFTIGPPNLKPVVEVRVLRSFSQPGEYISHPFLVRKCRYC